MNGPAEHRTNLPMRASDAERDRVEARLKHHYAVGRLALSELEARVATAYTARTREQLDDLLRDLPGGAEGRAPSGDVIDTRLMLILVCVAPPAALVYWLIAQRSARREGVQPHALDPMRDPEDGGEA